MLVFLNFRDFGFLSDDFLDDVELKEVYDRLFSWEEGDFIYDVSLKREDIYDVFLRYSDDIYNIFLSILNDIYDVFLLYRNVGKKVV